MVTISGSYTTQNAASQNSESSSMASVGSMASIESNPAKTLYADSDFRSAPKQARVIGSDVQTLKIAIPPRSRVLLADSIGERSVLNKSHFSKVITIEISGADNAKVMSLLAKNNTKIGLDEPEHDKTGSIKVGQLVKDKIGSSKEYKQFKTEFLQSRFDNNLTADVGAKVPRRILASGQQNTAKFTEFKRSVKMLQGANHILKDLQGQRRILEHRVAKSAVSGPAKGVTAANVAELKTELVRLRELEVQTLDTIDNANKSIRQSKPRAGLGRAFQILPGAPKLMLKAKFEQATLMAKQGVSMFLDQTRGVAKIEKPMSTRAAQEQTQRIAQFPDFVTKLTASAQNDLTASQALKVEFRNKGVRCDAVVNRASSSLSAAAQDIKNSKFNADQVTHKILDATSNLSLAKDTLKQLDKDTKLMKKKLNDITHKLETVGKEKANLEKMQQQKQALAESLPKAQADIVLQEIASLKSTLNGQKQQILDLGVMQSDAKAIQNTVITTLNAKKAAAKVLENNLSKVEKSLKTAVKLQIKTDKAATVQNPESVSTVITESEASLTPRSHVRSEGSSSQLTFRMPQGMTTEARDNTAQGERV